MLSSEILSSLRYVRVWGCTSWFDKENVVEADGTGRGWVRAGKTGPQGLPFSHLRKDLVGKNSEESGATTRAKVPGGQDWWGE